MGDAQVTLPDGWVSPQEAGELENLAREGTVLEVGAWLGLSTVTMAHVAKRLVSVDHHRGSTEHQSGGACHDATLVNQFGDVDTLPRFRMNLRQNRALDKVIIIVASFEDIAPLLAPESFDLVFIDADHTTDAVLRHAKLAGDLVAIGGALAFHDANWPTVRAAIEAYSLELVVPVERHEVGSLHVLRFI